MPLFSRLLNFASRVGVDSTDDRETRTRKNILTVASLSGSGALVFWSLPMFYVGQRLAGALWVVYAGLLVTLLAIWGVTHRGYTLVVFIHIASLLFFPFMLSLVTGSFIRTGSAWFALLAILAALIYFPRRFFWWCGVAALTVIVGLSIENISTPRFPAPLLSILYGGSFLTLGGMAVFMLYHVLRQRDAAYRLLQSEREKSESLLLNILPPEIADRLKQEPRVIADHFETASVLFADVVNFTPLSSQLTSEQLVELLNDVFSYFDALVEKYQVEKIKTIGDCYMVAAGVPRPRADHAPALAAMAIEMQAYVRQHEFQGRQLSFRIGINSGSLVAGVIGRKKFTYDLWGDAVNTASRMESHGQGGLIQITRSTYELIKDEFVCEPQGLLTIKGKGEMDVWHVRGRKALADG